MAACALYINGWPIELCIQYLDVAARLAFQKSLAHRVFLSLFGSFPTVAVVLQIFLSLLSNSKYSADRLEMIQKDVYGSRRSIMDSKEASRTGVMLGVTLTATHDTATYIVTNYNGVGQRRGRTGESTGSNMPIGY
jgi:hypothetical protein